MTIRIKMLAAVSIAAAIMALGATGVWAQVKNSKHDMSAVAGATTTEVCVFCHTPHGSDTAASAPLWNRNLVEPAGGYARYSSLGTATLDGAEVAVGSVSLACLSCHDGSQARDVVINAPGTGLAGNGVGTIGAMTGAPVPMLGSDLTNDHPISIAYAGGGCATATPGVCNPKGAGFVGDSDFNQAEWANINGQDQWWVNTTGGLATREKTDMILYTRDFDPDLVAVLNGPSVECGSCHDPHEATARPVSFMRISNDGSAVCLSCHTK